MSENVLTPGLLRDWALPTVQGTNKSARGDVLVVGGSRRTPGAVILAGIAALRAGAGRLTLAAPATTSVHIGVAVPESAVLDLAENEHGSVSRAAAATVIEAAQDSDAVLIGPGLDDPDETTALLANVLSELDGTSTVLDAYALGCLPRIAKPGPPAGLILTPNRTEAAFLSGSEVEDPAKSAMCIAREYQAVVCLEGHIADPQDRHWVTDSGHVGLGTSGSGDVLAGLIAGLLARGADPAQAACWGTYLHVTAGLRLAATGPIGFLARDLLDQAPRVLAELQIA